MAQISLSWLLSKGAFPIVGITNRERMQETIAALRIKLTDEEIAFLEEPYVAKSVVGY